MKKAKGKRQVREPDQDTMRPEYIIVLDPELMDAFPDSDAVDGALRRANLMSSR